ncbi:MAG: L-threonylcarbamoyladenylate synthase [Bacteroidota bacterium]|nr:L-threonylcarbamoyladenylate synthase [Bacteroidota bacterium]MEC9135224.1 L-threonylcarbamoyladenylate synthase [Bacteroidota bacterium]
MADLLKFYQSKPNHKLLKKAAHVLEQGGLIIYPTDTVYALGCLSNNIDGLQRLANIKQINLDKAPLSFFMRNFSDLSNYVRPLDNSTFKLLKRCLPGPYTFILPCLKLQKPFERRRSIGIRMAHHPILEALMDLVTAPLITSSLHDEDEILDYTTDPSTIYEYWENNIDLMLEDGYGGNIPSTVVDLCGTEPQLVREGKGNLNIL